MKDKVCLLITVFNRNEVLNRSLERLTRLTLPDEILVINDGGDESCENTVKNFEGRLPIKYIYNHNPEWSICSFSRNIGIKNTDCEIIITTEPEILFITDVIQQMLELHLQIPNKVISAGTIYHMGKQAILHNEMVNDPNNQLKLEAVNDSAHNTNPDDPRGYVRIKGWVAPFTALYRKEWLMEIGGWNEELEGAWGFDDTLLLTRLSKNGIGQHIECAIEVIHQWHMTLPPDEQYSAVKKNENYMNSLNWDLNDINNGIIANKNIEWGILKNK